MNDENNNRNDEKKQRVYKIAMIFGGILLAVLLLTLAFFVADYLANHPGAGLIIGLLGVGIMYAVLLSCG